MPKMKLSQSDDIPILRDAEEVPDKCFSLIFHRLDKKSILNCMLTCRRFETILSSNSFWENHAKQLGIEGVLPPVKWREAVVEMKFEGDLGTNDCNFSFNLRKMVLAGRDYSIIHPVLMSQFKTAEDMELKGYLKSENSIICARGDGIRVEVRSDWGCESDMTVRQCFAFSYHLCSITIFIDLVASGIDPWVLDHVRPKIRITQKANHRWDCASFLSFCAQLNYHKSQWIKKSGALQTSEDTDHPRFKSKNKEWKQWDHSDWEDWTLEFDDYPSGMRHLAVLNQGRDKQY